MSLGVQQQSIRRVAATLLACLLAACGTNVQHQASPAMWLVEDADTRLYLLGTMHALPAAMDWDKGKIGEAIASADTLILELSPSQLNAVGVAFGRLAPRTAPLAMDKRLPSVAFARYRALEASGSGQSFGGDALDDWAVMVMMGQRVAQNAKLLTANGVESGLTAHFIAKGKPVKGLETAEEQLMLFETLDPQSQRALLVRAAEESNKAPAEVAALTQAWARGDVTALETMINEDIDAVPAARAAIITDRNHRWSDWARARMQAPGTLIIAVGAGHLVGTDGLPALLAADGLRVTRVQ